MAEASKLVGGDDDTIIKADKGDLVIEVKGLLSKLEKSSTEVAEISRKKVKPSIYKIPEFLREVQPKAFEPCLVSFGPYHYGKPRLVEMEGYKKEGFLKFKAKYNLEFERIVESVCSILEHLLGSYDKLEDEWKQNPAMFLELMIVDGCFMLDFFEECPPLLSSVSWDIKRDMLLLENQLPMNLLQHIYTLAHKNQKDDIQGLILLICKPMFIGYGNVVIEKKLHILEMYSALLLYPPVDREDHSGKEKMYNQSDPRCQIIPQATKLREARIKFKKSPTNSLTDVSFVSKQGLLKLPYFVLNDYSETTLLNVMAFEKLHVDAGSQVTSFVILMDNLMDVDQDVALLVSNNILGNALRTDQYAANLFSLLGKRAAMDLDSHITDVHYKVNKHCNQFWNRWCASLKHNYFRNPWAIISLLGAIFGYAIVIVQVVYQIVDFHRGN